MQVFKKHNLTLNLEKCKFHQKSIDYLGFRLENQKIYPITSNIVKIKGFPRPKTKRQIKKFLGLCGFYRTLIPSYAELSDPLLRLTSSNKKIAWTEIEDQAFENLQNFFKELFLRQPDYNKTFILNTDASSYAISAVLLQQHGEHLLLVANFSKALRKAEIKYPAIQQELMAKVKGIATFRHILYGRKFII